MKCFRACFTLFVAILCIAGCGGEESAKKTADQKTATTAIDGGDEAAIEALFIEYIERMREGDKTVLYENEFDYYKDLISLTEYMEYPRVRDYVYDSLSHIVVDSVKVFGDSAWAYIRLFYESMDPEPVGHSYRSPVYRTDEGWKKPYLSHWEQHLEDLERIRAYEEAVKREQSEKKGN